MIKYMKELKNTIQKDKSNKRDNIIYDILN